MPPIYTVPVLPVVSLPLSSSRERSVRPSCGGNRNYTGTERETRHGGRVKNSSSCERMYNRGRLKKRKEKNERERKRKKSDDACLLNRLNKRQRAQR